MHDMDFVAAAAVDAAFVDGIAGLGSFDRAGIREAAGRTVSAARDGDLDSFLLVEGVDAPLPRRIKEMVAVAVLAAKGLAMVA